MTKPNSSSRHTVLATQADLRQILGDMDDETAVAILILEPTVAQIEEAGVWLNGANDVLGKERRPFDAVVARILDLVEVEDPEPRTPAPGP